MLSALWAGTTLVVDRYAYSGAAFTAAKGAAGLDLDWCRVRGPALAQGVERRSPCCGGQAHGVHGGGVSPMPEAWH